MTTYRVGFVLKQGFTGLVEVVVEAARPALATEAAWGLLGKARRQVDSWNEVIEVPAGTESVIRVR